MKKTFFKLITCCICAVLILGLSACNSKINSNVQSESSEIVIGETEPLDGFVIHGLVTGGGLTHYYKLAYEPLVEFENGNPVPVLAKSWENEDNTWTFHLREGVTFTDGEIFNAEAVKLNFEALQQNMIDMISYYGAVSRIKKIEVLDEYTVRFYYDKPYYAVLEELSSSIFGMISPAMLSDGNFPDGSEKETFGTGPYVLKSDNCSEGSSYTFTRNENYWGKASGPDLVTVKIIPDPDARTLALQAGEIDILYGTYQITYDMYETLASQDGLTAVQSESAYATRNLLLNTARENLNDLNVRQAIQHGVNKKEIADTILHGLESTADTLFPTSIAFCDVKQTVYEYDPNLAESLLDEAGWKEKNAQGIRIKDGRTLTLEAICMSERTIDEQLLTAFKGQMAKLGIEVNISPYETNKWFELGLSGEFDISVNDTYAFPQDPQVFVAAMLDYGLDNPAQQGLAQKADIDANIETILTTVDENTLKNAYAYVLTTLQDEAVNLTISGMHEIAIYNSEKIESFVFSDDPIYCNVSKIVMKQ